MTSRTLTLRLRRRIKRSRRQVEDLGLLAGEQLDEHLIRRFSRFFMVWRFVTAWFLLFVLCMACVASQAAALTGYYTSPGFVPGGIYDEGILGDFTNASPLYATSPVDQTVSRLMFSSLLTYNNRNQLVGDLAAGWSVNSTGRVYTVHLKPDIYWQDGQPLTAQDVVFTYHVIQDPDAESPLQSSWQDVTVTAANPSTVVFTLANPLSSFPYSLTNGIVPQHLLKNIPMTEMRSALFNTVNPIGSGPFKWKSIEVSGGTPSTRQERIVMTPFRRYFGSKPKLSAFVIDAYHNKNMLIKNFQQGTLTAMVGLNHVPASVAHDSGLTT